jgi:Fe-S cluster assembly iron-binding protein IscA
MVAVTDRAKQKLLEQKQAANIAEAEMGLRVAAAPTGQWMLVADHVRGDDQIVTHMGSTVLLVDPVAQEALDGVRVDCLETAEGDVELFLTAEVEGDDDYEDDDDDDEDEVAR